MTKYVAHHNIDSTTHSGQLPLNNWKLILGDELLGISIRSGFGVLSAFKTGNPFRGQIYLQLV